MLSSKRNMSDYFDQSSMPFKKVGIECVVKVTYFKDNGDSRTLMKQFDEGDELEIALEDMCSSERPDLDSTKSLYDDLEQYDVFDVDGKQQDGLFLPDRVETRIRYRNQRRTLLEDLKKDEEWINVIPLTMKKKKPVTEEVKSETVKRKASEEVNSESAKRKTSA